MQNIGSVRQSQQDKKNLCSNRKLLEIIGPSRHNPSFPNAGRHPPPDTTKNPNILGKNKKSAGIHFLA